MGNDRHKREDFDNYKKYIDQLENEYLETFIKIELYINGSTKLNEQEKNNCFMQILDTFLSGQAEGKSIKSITGRDLKKFCDNMICGESIYMHKVTKVFNTVFYSLYWVMIFHFCFAIFDAIELKEGIDRNKQLQLL